MGQCYGKNVSVAGEDSAADAIGQLPPRTPSAAATPAWPSPLPSGVSPSPARSTPRRFFKRPFPPPSPAKHIKASLAKRQDPTKPPILEEESNNNGDGGGDNNGGGEGLLDKRFGYGKNFGAKYEVVKEVGRGHFGHSCSARTKKGEMKEEIGVVRIISKANVRCKVDKEEAKILKGPRGKQKRFEMAEENQGQLHVEVDSGDLKKTWSAESLASFPSGKMCVCSPTNHPGSFRCRHHRQPSNSRSASPRSSLYKSSNSGELFIVNK